MSVGAFPFGAASDEDEQYKCIIDGHKRQFWKSALKGKKDIDPSLKELIWSLLSYSPKHRPSLEEIKNHKWMKQSSKTKIKKK